MGIVNFDFRTTWYLFTMIPSIRIFFHKDYPAIAFSWLFWNFEISYDNTEYNFEETYNYELKIDESNDEQY